MTALHAHYMNTGLKKAFVSFGDLTDPLDIARGTHVGDQADKAMQVILGLEAVHVDDLGHQYNGPNIPILGMLLSRSTVSL